MKLISWLLALLLATFTVFTLRGQSIELRPNTKWSVEYPSIEVPKYKIYNIDTVGGCPYEKVDPVVIACVYNTKRLSSTSDIPEPVGRINLPLTTSSSVHHGYTYNFLGHLSVSVGVKLSEMSVSKFRVEWESDTRTEHWTVGGLLSFYTLSYYYVGVRPEVFTRFYFVQNTSGEGAFLQGRMGYGRFWGDGLSPFGGLGFGVDVGNKFIVIGNDSDYSNSFTLTPMGGVQFYPGPDGTTPLSWVWQLRFGYQFGGGRR
jgi:hypothetical protein